MQSLTLKDDIWNIVEHLESEEEKLKELNKLFKGRYQSRLAATKSRLEHYYKMLSEMEDNR